MFSFVPYQQWTEFKGTHDSQTCKFGAQQQSVPGMQFTSIVHSDQRKQKALLSLFMDTRRRTRSMEKVHIILTTKRKDIKWLAPATIALGKRKRAMDRLAMSFLKVAKITRRLRELVLNEADAGRK